MPPSRIPAILAIAVITLSTLPSAATVIVNEIMYNSPGTDVEYVELYNRGPYALALDGWYLLDNDPLHPKCYLVGTLASGDFLVVAADSTLFAIQYPGVTNVNPNYFNPGGTGFGLGNSGDTVNVYTPGDVLYDTVTYSDGGDWPGEADGNGPSLELIYPFLDNNVPASWEASLVSWGTPGEQNRVYQVDQTPVCQDGARDIPLPTSADDVTVTVIAYDHEALATIQLWVDMGEGFSATDMYDDGLHGDSAPGDSIFGAVIPARPDGTLVRYYAIATDDIGQSDAWPNSAPTEYRAYTVGHEPPALRLNEVLASNVTGITDEYGQHEDWLEIYNEGAVPVALGGMFLSDEADRTHQWQLPEFDLYPGQYLVVWADNDEAQGSFHASFRFSAIGEFAGLFETEDHGNVLISGFEFGRMSADVSVGYQPDDGHVPEYLATPSPGASNAGSPLFSDVCINEFHTTSSGGGFDDWIELYNRGAAVVDISGWLISDERVLNAKWAFPLGTVLAPGEFVVVGEAVLGFGWSSLGDEVVMLSASDSLTGMDFYDYGPQQPDISEGRYPDGQPYWYFFSPPTAGAENDNVVAVPEAAPADAGLQLLGNYPNPFNPSTRIQLSLGASVELSVRIFSVDGRSVRDLFRGTLPAGRHDLLWDGRDDAGRALASGLYLVQGESAGEAQRHKLLLLK